MRPESEIVMKRFSDKALVMKETENAIMMNGLNEFGEVNSVLSNKVLLP